ncbi:MAG: hypothetical protein AB8F95_20220 [Bacteroidia bacterium]
MNKAIFFTIVVCLAACGPRPAAINEGITTEINPVDKGVLKGFSSPESVLGIDTFVFVSNVGPELKPRDKDGDGFISKLNNKGNVVNLRFIEGLHAPKGMAVWDSVLYVADIDVIRAFHWKTGDSLDLFDLKAFGVRFLNDLCQGDSGMLFVSETFQDTIYSIDVKRRDKENNIRAVSIPKDAAVQSVNGLWYDAPNRDLYLCGFGQGDSTNGAIGVIPMGARAVPPRNWVSHTGKLDGLVLIGRKLYVTDWAGFETSSPLWEVDLSTYKAKAVFTKQIGGPADFWYDEKNKRFWIPAMTEGRVYVHE